MLSLCVFFQHQILSTNANCSKEFKRSSQINESFNVTFSFIVVAALFVVVVVAAVVVALVAAVAVLLLQLLLLVHLIFNSFTSL